MNTNGLNYETFNFELFMKRIIPIAFLLWAVSLWGCDADQVGCLLGDHAGYTPDRVSFKAKLDPENPGDMRRKEFRLPFKSGSLKGLEGGFPRRFEITGIRCESELEEGSKQFYMLEGESDIYLAFDHTVLPGEYIFTIKVTNENGRNALVFEDALTIVIE